MLESGNVGIGTTSPSDKLHVNGGNLRISAAAGGGVYDNGYQWLECDNDTAWGRLARTVRTNGIACYNGIAINDNGGLVVGSWDSPNALGVGNGKFTGDLTVDGAIYAPGHPVQYVGQNVHDIVVYGNSIGRYITPLDITITPKFSNSKIMLHWVINAEAHHDQVIRIYRFISSGASSLIGFNSNNQGVHSGAAPIHHDNDHNSTMNTHTVAWVDTPNTTSAVTYRVYCQTSTSSNQWITLNKKRNGASTGQNAYEVAVSYKSAMEIAV